MKQMLQILSQLWKKLSEYKIYDKRIVCKRNKMSKRNLFAELLALSYWVGHLLQRKIYF